MSVFFYNVNCQKIINSAADDSVGAPRALFEYMNMIRSCGIYAKYVFGRAARRH
jgi:hypothetical protein